MKANHSKVSRPRGRAPGPTFPSFLLAYPMCALGALGDASAAMNVFPNLHFTAEAPRT